MTDKFNSTPPSDNGSPSRDFVRMADQASAHNQGVIFDALAEARIHTLTVTFDGYGDSGQIESIEAFDAANEPIELPAQRELRLLTPHQADTPLAAEQQGLREAIEALVYEYLEATHIGWEDGEGAYGTFVFAVRERSVTLEHNQRFLDSDTTIHTF